MNAKHGLASIVGAALVATAPLYGAENAVDDILPRVSLVDVLDAVSENSGRTFVIDHRAMPSIVIGQPDPSSMEYPQLLTVLRNNALAAVHSEGGLTSIVPVQAVRQHALPLLREPDAGMAEDEWVTWQVAIENGHASHYVPILRPMLPQEGHLAAEPASNTITIVDRYANARRIVELIEAMDAATEPDGQTNE